MKEYRLLGRRRAARSSERWLRDSDSYCPGGNRRHGAAGADSARHWLQPGMDNYTNGCKNSWLYLTLTNSCVPFIFNISVRPQVTDYRYVTHYEYVQAGGRGGGSAIEFGRGSNRNIGSGYGY